MERQYICTIEGVNYYVGNFSNKLYLFEKDAEEDSNEKHILEIVKITYKNWEGDKVRFIPNSGCVGMKYLNVLQRMALQEALDYLNKKYGT